MNGLNKIEIIQGDALTLLSNITSNSIDVVMADPPYNLGKDYGNDSDKKCFHSYLDFSKKWIKECHRILKPDWLLLYYINNNVIYLVDTGSHSDFKIG
jgi:DNA modification methylase